jgi:hypothetical protein
MIKLEIWQSLPKIAGLSDNYTSVSKLALTSKAADLTLLSASLASGVGISLFSLFLKIRTVV